MLLGDIMAKIAKQNTELQLSDELINSLVIDDELAKLLGIETQKEKIENEKKQEQVKKDKKIIK